jgi:hypothetical protein
MVYEKLRSWSRISCEVVCRTICAQCIGTNCFRDTDVTPSTLGLGAANSIYEFNMRREYHA